MSTRTLERFAPNALRELAFGEEHGGFSLTLKRNCSISPSGLACVFFALAAVVLVIGAGFAIAGAWLILPFAGLEVLLLGGAFMLQARHAADYERIALESGRLSVEVSRGERVERYDMDARRRLELGRHLDEPSRMRFGAELKKRLRN